MTKKIVLLFGLMILLAACGGETGNTSAVTAPVATDTSAAEVTDAGSLPDLGARITVDVAAAVRDNPDVFMLDVREQYEYDAGHIPGITLIPVGEIASRLDELPRDKEIIVTCQTGGRSRQITAYLRNQGFTNVHDMAGGLSAWAAAGYDVAR